MGLDQQIRCEYAAQFADLFGELCRHLCLRDLARYTRTAVERGGALFAELRVVHRVCQAWEQTTAAATGSKFYVS